jgi:hypothetical protein
VSDLIIPDVSEFQGAVEWPRLVAAGYPVAIARVHNGDRADERWPANRDQAHAAGVRALGLYQYVVADRDAGDQAAEFCALVGQLRPGEWPICDLEVGDGDQASRARAWYTTVAARLQDASAEQLYSGLDFYQAHGLAAAGYPRIWLAAYGPSEPTMPHELWQFTDARDFPGIANPCDASVFHGTVADLLTHITPEDEMPLNAQDEDTIKTIVAAAITANRASAVSDDLYWWASVVTGVPPKGAPAVDVASIATLHAAIAGPAAQAAANGAALTALTARVGALQGALAALSTAGITAAQVTAAAEAGAVAALAELGHTLAGTTPAPTT